MMPVKPSKTLADWLVIGASPALIMALVGSLSFFLIEVFFRGEAMGSVRWVMGWFVLAVVLITRIGIEQGRTQAMVYGVFLAMATWAYLVRIHPAFILGAILLGIVWWCAHKLTWDCTLIDEEEDGSGGGLIDTACDRQGFGLFRKKFRKTRLDKAAAKGPAVTPHSPGLWVVWFSVAALPLFGIGQMLLPRADRDARHAGFVFLFVYVAAALGLLLTTSFLGLRRYLRQRYLTMPGMMAFGWMRFGVGVAALVLIGALLLPRPGATAAWHALGYQIDYKIHQASDYAAKFGPHGSGKGRAGNEQDKSAQQANGADQTGTQKTPGESPETDGGKADPHQETASPPPPPAAAPLYHLFKALFIVGVVCLAAWWLFRNREMLSAMAKSLMAAIRQFLANLFQWRLSAEAAGAATPQKAGPKKPPFSLFQNPFLTGKDSAWTREQLVLYSYEALRAWAAERGLDARSEMTAREFILDLCGRHPEMSEDLRRLAFLHSHAAYGAAIPTGRDLEPVKQIWRRLQP